MKKEIKKGDYVSASTAETKTTICGFVEGKQTTKGGETLFKIEGQWFMENTVKPKTPHSWTPTDGQMKVIKGEYPFLKKGKVKVIYECGHDTEEGFSGIFGFIWENANQSGKVLYKKGEFKKMEDKFARQFGF